jgi:hypothetical protein
VKRSTANGVAAEAYLDKEEGGNKVMGDIEAESTVVWGEVPMEIKSTGEHPIHPLPIEADIPSAAFLALAAFPKVTKHKVLATLNMMEDWMGSVQSLIEVSFPVLVDGLSVDSVFQLVQMLQGTLVLYERLWGAKGIVGAHFLLLNLLFWETIQWEVSQSGAPDHLTHQFHSLVKDYVWGAAMNKKWPLKLVIEWADISEHGTLPPSSTEIMIYTNADFKTKDKVGLSEWRSGFLSVEEQIVYIISTFYGLTFERQCLALFTQAVIDQLGLKVLLLNSVSSFLHYWLQQTLGVHQNPSVAFV